MSTITCEDTDEMTGIGGVDGLPGDEPQNVVCGAEATVKVSFTVMGQEQTLFMCDEHRERITHDAAVETFIEDLTVWPIPA